MPTENRSSDTEMVSVPEGFMLVERSILTEKQVDAATACITRLKGVPTMTDRALAVAAIDAAQCTAPDIALSDLLPAPQPHPEPIAWMVGTAIWWTKEEAERDAWRYRHAKPGMSWFFTESPDASGCLVDGFEYEVSPLYVRADPGEVERLREGIAKHWKVVCDQRAEIESLRDQLIKVVRSGALTAPEHEALEPECCALSASAEPQVKP